jgi:predicted RNA-binding Zn-ribbon protein involved in translation (DUF1610 family)
MENIEIIKEKALSDENAELVSGAGDPKHYCGTCGELMVFAYKQDYAYPMVYRCPQCGDMCAYKK